MQNTKNITGSGIEFKITKQNNLQTYGQHLNKSLTSFSATTKADLVTST